MQAVFVKLKPNNDRFKEEVLKLIPETDNEKYILDNKLVTNGVYQEYKRGLCIELSFSADVVPEDKYDLYLEKAMQEPEQINKEKE